MLGRQRALGRPWPSLFAIAAFAGLGLIAQELSAAARAADGLTSETADAPSAIGAGASTVDPSAVGAATGNITFVEVGASVGLGGDTYGSPTGHSLGVAWIDFDADGWPDLFAVGGDPSRPPRLFHNQGDGTFAPAHHLLPPLPAVEMSGAVFADADNDGDSDLFVYTDNTEWKTMGPANPPDGPLDLFLRNLFVERGGVLPTDEPLFEEVAEAVGLAGAATPALGALPGHRTKTAAWLDVDRDGCIDLFVGRLVLNAIDEPGNLDTLYRNRCDGTFEDAGAAVGIHQGSDEASRLRPTLAAGGFHLDNDLWPDLYAVHVSALGPVGEHHDVLYRGAGPTAPGTLVDETALSAGVGDDAQAGMGIDVADIDLDGDWDVYLTDLLDDTPLEDPPWGNVLYPGAGSDGSPATLGDNQATASGVVADASWGVNFFDADRDGDEDLFVASLWPGPDFLYRNDGVPRAGDPVAFVDVGAAAGLVTGSARGSAVADYDRDGDLDLAVVDQNGPLSLFRNDTVSSGHWLTIDLDGRASGRSAIGTVVEVTAGGLTQRRQVKGGSSAHSQDDLAVHFGLGDATEVDSLRVRWLSGAETLRSGPIAVDQRLPIIESLLHRDGFETGDTRAWSLAIP